MAKDTFECCRTCGICQLTKQSTQRPVGVLKPLPILERPFTHISMDFLCLPQVTNKTTQVLYDHIWVIVDRFSKYTIILPLPINYTTEHLINVYNNSVYLFFGFPQDVVTDRDVLFTSLAWRKFCTVNTITQSMFSTYHPETDGQSEIANKSIITILHSKLLDQGLDWLAALPSVQVAINTGIDTSRDASPHTLCIRFTPKFEKEVIVPAASLRPSMISNALWDSVKTKLVRSHVGMTQPANKRRRPSPQYQAGDLVQISSSFFPKDTQFNKLEPVFMGPYKLRRCIPETDNYTVEIPFAPSGAMTVYTSLLAPWLENSDGKFPSRMHTLPGPVTTDATAPRYKVERLLKHRTWKDKFEFLVKWLGYGDEHNSWQNREYIDKDIVMAYWEKSRWPGKVQTRCAGGRNRARVWFSLSWPLVSQLVWVLCVGIRISAFLYFGLVSKFSLSLTMNLVLPCTFYDWVFICLSLFSYCLDFCGTSYLGWVSPNWVVIT